MDFEFIPDHAAFRAELRESFTKSTSESHVEALCADTEGGLPKARAR